MGQPRHPVLYFKEKIDKFGRSLISAQQCNILRLFEANAGQPAITIHCGRPSTARFIDLIISCQLIISNGVISVRKDFEISYRCLFVTPDKNAPRYNLSKLPC